MDQDSKTDKKEETGLTPKWKIAGLALGVYIIANTFTSIVSYFKLEEVPSWIPGIVSVVVAFMYWTHRMNNQSYIKRDAFIILPLVVLIYGLIFLSMGSSPN